MNTLATHAPIDLAKHLIGLAGIESALTLPFQIPPKGDRVIDRVMGIVDVIDDASVHADFWEIHPAGDEILLLVSGRLGVTVAPEGRPEISVDIGPGEAFIVPRATWHRLQVIEPGRMLFCTPGARSEVRRCGSVRSLDGETRAGARRSVR